MDTVTGISLTIKKRDGRTVDFDKSKISAAIKKSSRHIEALSPIENSIIDSITNDVISKLQRKFKDEVEISDIQYLVEQTLIEHHQDTWAQEYISYRTKRDMERNNKTDIEFNVKQVIDKDDSVVHENANKDSRIFTTQRDLLAGAVSKAAGLKMLPPAVANAHLKGDIHWHDLDYSPYTSETNCCLVDFKTMLTNGFELGNAQVEPAHSIQVATAQVSQIIASVASSQYGGQSFDRADETLAIFAEKNYQHHLKEAPEFNIPASEIEHYAKSRTIKDINDAMQSLEYEINTLFSTQGQTPFVTVGFGLGTSWIEREIQKAILNIRINGLGKDHRTAIFPKLIFGIKRGLNSAPTDPNYDIKQLALECATKRMYPDVINYDKITEITGNYKASMGCRSFLQKWVDPKTGEEVNSGRNNLGVVTLNTVRIALETKNDPNAFWNLLEDRLEICKQALVYRIERAKQSTPEAAPILYKNGAFGAYLNDTDSVDQLFNNSRATVSLGYIGLYEVGTVFFGPDWEKNSEAKEFTLNVVKYMAEKCEEWEEEYGYHFSVYSTPSESLTDRFCRIDKEKFGSIENITDKDYYTNSFHYDVRKQPTPFEKLDFEAPYPHYASGGFIHYCEYPNLKQNPKALETVWDYAYDKVAYLGTNTPIDQCFECGFKGEFDATSKGFQCPDCGNHNPDTCDVVKRTCGYLGNPQKRPMVHGRQEEIVSRKKHMSISNNEIANANQNI